MHQDNKEMLKRPYNVPSLKCYGGLKDITRTTDAQGAVQDRANKGNDTKTA